MDRGEASDERLGQPVSKVFLGWVARQVFQRQYRHGLDVRLPRALSTAAAIQHQSDGAQCEYGDSPQQHPQGTETTLYR